MAPDCTQHIKTFDGVSLAYNQRGPADGPNVLFIAGWCQTAAQWQKQYDGLAESFRVTTYDHRGHGKSQKADRGFRISRLAADLHDLVSQLDLRDVVLVGHSMGSAVIWSYWDLFQDSRARIKGLVLVDQPPCMIPPPSWAMGGNEDVGPPFAVQEPSDIASTLQGTDRKTFVSGLIPAMLTKNAAQEDVDWMIDMTLLVDPASAGALILDHAKNDWRDVIRTIDKPTLVFAGTGSICPLAASKWHVANIQGARLVTIKGEDGGSHFMFWENPKCFNAALDDFVESLARIQM